MAATQVVIFAAKHLGLFANAKLNSCEIHEAVPSQSQNVIDTHKQGLKILLFNVRIPNFKILFSTFLNTIM